MTTKRVILGMTGASGVVYGLRLLDLLVQCDLSVDLVMSSTWWQVGKHELGVNHTTDSDFLLKSISTVRSFYCEKAKNNPDSNQNFDEKEKADFLKHIRIHGVDNFASEIASGSVKLDAMIIAPCSSNTLASIATGVHRHLIHRAAEVHLKERRPLVLLVRESPLSLIHLENMERVTRAGGIIQVASPTFYQTTSSPSASSPSAATSAFSSAAASSFPLVLPSSADLIDSVVTRSLDLLHIPHSFGNRYSGMESM
ncbi:MAG: UbiX family flavin prenyltransferase [Thermoguttaceae bacterium]